MQTNSSPCWIESATLSTLLLSPATPAHEVARLARDTGLLILPQSPAHGKRTVLTLSHGRPPAREVRT